MPLSFSLCPSWFIIPIVIIIKLTAATKMALYVRKNFWYLIGRWLDYLNVVLINKPLLIYRTIFFFIIKSFCTPLKRTLGTIFFISVFLTLVFKVAFSYSVNVNYDLFMSSGYFFPLTVHEGNKFYSLIQKKYTFSILLKFGTFLNFLKINLLKFSIS